MTPEILIGVTLDGGDFGIDFVQQGDQVGCGFAGPVLCTGNQALALLDDGDGLFLDGSGDCKIVLCQAEDEFLFKVEFSERFVLGWLDVLQYLKGLLWFVI
jgi:hypothetical protein